MLWESGSQLELVAAGWSRSVFLNRDLAVKRFNTRECRLSLTRSCCHGSAEFSLLPHPLLPRLQPLLTFLFFISSLHFDAGTRAREVVDRTRERRGWRCIHTPTGLSGTIGRIVHRRLCYFQFPFWVPSAVQNETTSRIPLCDRERSSKGATFFFFFVLVCVPSCIFPGLRSRLRMP